MQLQFHKSTWGMEGSPEAVLGQIQAAGYDGYESVLDFIGAAQGKSDLTPIGQSFPASVDDMKRDIDRAGEYGVILLDVQAGRDWWSFDEGCRFFEGSLKAVADSGLNVCFETHRGKLLYSPVSTAEYLARFPEMRITADFSHWTNVCESLLWDQEETMAKVIPYVGYLHARVGHEEGPQVPDPRVPQWEGHVQRFEQWWDAIYQAFEARGETVFRVDPEFGPPNYLWTDPQGARPLADLFEVCGWMRDRLAKRWNP